MDFKVTGTVDGITATQMDIKCDGLPYEILEQALHQAKEGRLHILNLINEAIPEARADYKPHVPRIVTMTVDKEFIGAIIGKGGEVIQGLQEETGTTISIEEIDGKGIVEIAAANKDSINAAVARIEAIIAVPEEGQVYTGKVVSILEFGAFVEFMPGRDRSPLSSSRLTRRPASSACRCVRCRTSPRVMTSAAMVATTAVLVPVAMATVVTTVAPAPVAIVPWVAATTVVPVLMDRVVPAVTTVATTSNMLNSSLKIGAQEHNINKTRG